MKPRAESVVGVAARLPERAGSPIKAQIRQAAPSAAGDVRKADPVLDLDVLKADERSARRAVLAAVLYDAFLIMRVTRLKQQAAFLQRDPRTLRRWFDGLEPIPWEELLTIRALQFPLAQALLESCQADMVEITTSIQRRVSAAVKVAS